LVSTAYAPFASPKILEGLWAILERFRNEKEEEPQNGGNFGARFAAGGSSGCVPITHSGIAAPISGVGYSDLDPGFLYLGMFRSQQMMSFQ
jgi:hypothetical protein